MPQIKNSSAKVGVYVDTSNLYRSGGYRMRYDVLREFACRDGAQIQRLNTYVSYDADRAKQDHVYAKNVNRFYNVIRDFGYKVIVKEVKWYEDESGKRFGKANADLDLAVDMLLQTQNLDRVLLATGDGDFVRVISAVQNRGCRVEVVGLDNVSADLKREADLFVSGYLIPNLIPIGENGDRPAWGEEGSRVRGMCYFHKRDYGFMRFLRGVGSNLWVTDTQHPDSPYQSAYFNDSNLPEDMDPGKLPSYNYVFEFELTQSTQRNGSCEANGIEVVGWVPS